MTMFHLLRSLIVICLAVQLCNGTCYWRKPRQKKISICSASTTVKTSSKFSAESSQNAISDIETHLKKIEANSAEDSSEVGDDSSEDLNYRESRSTLKLKRLVRSRTLSKKIKKSIHKSTTRTAHARKATPYVINVAGTVQGRSINNGFQRSFQRTTSTITSANTLSGSGNIVLSIPAGYVANTVSTTITRLLTEQEAVRLGLMSATSVSGSTTSSTSSSSSSYFQNGVALGSSGTTVSRSINNNNMMQVENSGNANGYYSNDNTLHNNGGSFNVRHTKTKSIRSNKFSSVNDDVNNNNNIVDYNNDYASIGNNQNTGSSVNYRSVKTVGQYKRQSANGDDVQQMHNKNVDDDGDYASENDVDKESHRGSVEKNDNCKTGTVHNQSNGGEIHRVGQRTETKRVEKIGTASVRGVKSNSNDSGDDKSNESKCAAADGDGGDDDNENKCKTQVVNKHATSATSVVSKSTGSAAKTVSGGTLVNEGGTGTQSSDDGGDDVTGRTVGGSGKSVKSIHKQTVSVTRRRSLGVNKSNYYKGIVSGRSARSDGGDGSTKGSDGGDGSTEGNDGGDGSTEGSDEEDDDDDDDDNDDDSSEEDEVSVYEHLNTFHRYRFDKGLSSIGIIGEVLRQLDYQRYTLMDDVVYPQDSSRHVADGQLFDFVIVGGGNAGCVLANRLSETAHWNVLLIEAGGNPLPVTQVPGLWDRSLNSAADWQYKLEPDSATGFGISGNIVLHKGKCLGGSSTTGPPVHVRGSEKLYDTLAERGLDNWTYGKTETYFRKAERTRSVTTKTTEANHTVYGTCGLLPVNRFRQTEVTVLQKLICTGFEHVGCKQARDINDAGTEAGFVPMVGAISNGRTVNTAKAYLGPTFGRDNLKVMKRATATRLVMDADGARAVGVEVRTKYGQTLTVRADKEVLVCAGAVGSAKLLMASGIGPAEHLSAMHVPVVKDLKVGQKLLVAPVFAGLVVSYDKPLALNLTADEVTFKYLARRSGPLSRPDGMSFGGFLSTGASETADIEVHQFYVPQGSHNTLCRLRSTFGFSDGTLSAYARLNADRAISVFTVALTNVHSAGRVLLRNGDPTHGPLVVGNLLSDDRDAQSLLDAVKTLARLDTSAALRLVDARLEAIDLDGCAMHATHTDDHWRCLLKYMVSTTSSTAGSCPMGPSTDADAVVDGELNVHGVSGLRVVGRAAMPFIASAYSHAPCVMIAERACDMIRSKYD